MFSKLKSILSEIDSLLAPDREGTYSVFEKASIIGFRRAKSLKDILLRAKVAPLEKKKGCCKSCEDTRCKTWKNFVTTKKLNLHGFIGYINPFSPNAPFLYPLKTSENRKVFWCFQGVDKGCIGNECIKQTTHAKENGNVDIWIILQL